jgi:hypothetical protein
MKPSTQLLILAVTLTFFASLFWFLWSQSRKPKIEIRGAGISHTKDGMTKYTNDGGLKFYRQEDGTFKQEKK